MGNSGEVSRSEERSALALVGGNSGPSRSSHLARCYGECVCVGLHKATTMTPFEGKDRRSRQNGWLGTRVRESQMTFVCVRVATSSEVVHRGHRDDRGARECIQEDSESKQI